MIDLQPGSQFHGEYEIIRQLGAGGMGAVYLARRTSKRDELVAIKVLYPGRIKNAEARERFRNEVTATFQVKHENVVRGFEYIDQEDFQAYVMEFVDGGDLLEKMKAGKLETSRVVRYLKQITAGLAAVHAQAIIHRDLKPDNLLYDATTDCLKLHDFGVARLKGANPLTMVGTMVGTPKYLSPEYVETGYCDHRGDIYAAGVIGFEMATGQSPFRSVSKLSLMVERLKTRIPPVLDVDPECPPELARIIDKAIALKVSERYQSVQAMYEDLCKFESPKPKAKKVELAEPAVLIGPGIKRPAQSSQIFARVAAAVVFWTLLSAAIAGGLVAGAGLAAASSGTPVREILDFERTE